MYTPDDFFWVFKLLMFSTFLPALVVYIQVEIGYHLFINSFKGR